MVLYPSGLRGESAKLLFSGSNPLGTSILPCGVIGNTSDFGSDISGSSPDGVTKFIKISFDLLNFYDYSLFNNIYKKVKHEKVS